MSAILQIRGSFWIEGVLTGLAQNGQGQLCTASFEGRDYPNLRAFNREVYTLGRQVRLASVATRRLPERYFEEKDLEVPYAPEEVAGFGVRLVISGTCGTALGDIEDIFLERHFAVPCPDIAFYEGVHHFLSEKHPMDQARRGLGIIYDLLRCLESAGGRLISPS